ncbi:MAG: hypothetical protein EON58_21480 [Alphaproteobacteria bacterium]|nr:MAG: hypothetical protein EON58_21480 [Alphaproteobacteria bacterium]
MASTVHAMEHFASAAVFDFARRAAVPIFRADGEHGNPLATGTFMEINGQLALITARHILDDCHPKDIAIPQSWTGSHLSTLGPLEVVRPVDLDDLEIDIIAIVLTDEASRETFAIGWTVIDPSIGMTPLEYGSRDVLIVGYPAVSFVRDGYMIQSPPPLIIETGRLAEIPSQAKSPIDPDLDLFFDHSSTGCKVYTEMDNPPHPGGMSGCSIWQAVSDEQGAVWLPENALRLIGIQSSALPGKFLRGKSWEFISELLEHV